MVMYKRGSRVGFFGRISRGWKVTKLGMAVIRADPELMVYTFLSAVLSIFAIGAAISGSIGLEIFSGGFDSETTSNEEGANDLVNAGHMAIWFAFYLVISVITVFWNSAIIASAYERMSAGTNPSFSYGIKQAMKCLPQILIWGVISGTVGLFLQILEGISKDSDAPIPIRAVAGLASFILGIAWWIATFFVIPMIVLERSGVIDGMSQPIMKGKPKPMRYPKSRSCFLEILLVMVNPIQNLHDKITGFRSIGPEPRPLTSS